MRIFDLKTQKEITEYSAPVVLMLGNFDGVHLGHRRLAELAEKEGRRLGVKAGVWTFEDHTLQTLENRRVPVLTTKEEKNALFGEMGLDIAIYEDFESVKDMPKEMFVTQHLANRLNCACAVCGFNYRFGKGGEGDAGLLKELMASLGRGVITAEPVVKNGLTVSSSAIRSLLEEGMVDEASIMLGRPYSLTSEIVKGKRLGTSLGFPTANQRFRGNKLRLKNGIYVCTCTVDGKEYCGVANVGSRPTVNENESDVNCETYIMGYNGDLYGKTVKTEFLKRLRDERRFGDTEELRNAVASDVKAAEDYFSKRDGRI